MKKEVLIMALVVFMSLSIVNAAEDNIIASISNPRMVLFKNLTSDSLTFENSVIVNNENEFPVGINVEPAGIWADKIEVKEESFVLQPDERKEIFYDVTLTESGEFGGDIIVVFEKEDYLNTLSIAQRLVVHVTDNRELKESVTGNAIGNSGAKALSISAVIFVLVLIVGLLMFTGKKRVKKSGEKNKGKK